MYILYCFRVSDAVHIARPLDISKLTERKKVLCPIKNKTSLEKRPKDRCANESTPASKFGNSAGRTFRNIASLRASKVPAANVSQLALAGQECSIGSDVGHIGSKGAKVGVSLQV